MLRRTACKAIDQFRLLMIIKENLSDAVSKKVVPIEINTKSICFKEYCICGLQMYRKVFTKVIGIEQVNVDRCRLCLK